ncbi:MAG: hypothetical protein NT178_17040 [Proteobacteria bacterium]|nr:hypothetical protein [Pseudomonadota bacterium]
MDYSCIRAVRIIRSIIEKLNLNLRHTIVLTEVGSEHFLYTPIIPALAGAEKVYAIVKDSKYGKGSDVKNRCIFVAKYLGLNNIEIFVNRLPKRYVHEADIITNSNHIRPIDKTFLSATKRNVVIPLMYESWELRVTDIDIDFCRKLNIKVAGTWENHPNIKVFDYVRNLCIKMAFEAGYEISGNKIIIWSNDQFGNQAYIAFKLLGAKEIIICNSYENLKANLDNVDFVFICDYKQERDYFNRLDGLWNIEELIKINNYFGVIHLYGNISIDSLKEYSVNIYPNIQGRSNIMSLSLNHVGLLPVINLLAAGFKVGEEMLKGETSNLYQPITF